MMDRKELLMLLDEKGLSFDLRALIVDDVLDIINKKLKEKDEEIAQQQEYYRIEKVKQNYNDNKLKDLNEHIGELQLKLKKMYLFLDERDKKIEILEQKLNKKNIEIESLLEKLCREASQNDSLSLENFSLENKCKIIENKTLNQVCDKAKIELRQKVILMKADNCLYKQHAILWEDVVEILKKIGKGE